jgi:hypothetical protein
MNTSNPSSSVPADRPRAGKPRRWARTRNVDVGLLLGSSAAVAITMLLWTGVVPSGLYPSSPLRWSLEVPTCTYVGEALPSVQHAFPLWATVHVQWSAQGGYVLYEVFGRAYTPIFQVGTNGSGSFVSNALAFAFTAVDPLPPNGSGCPSILVTTTVTYTI